MGKNVFGGNSHKKFARKHNEGSSSKDSRLRVATDELEVYSIVTKLLGNKMFHCIGIDNVTRLGHIRGKFSGKGKRDNMIVAGSWILVGLREWNEDKTEGGFAKTEGAAATKTKMPECDLLEIYSDSEKSRLVDGVRQNWSVLFNNDCSQGQNSSHDELFATEQEMEREALMATIKAEANANVSVKMKDVEKEEEINIDDI